MRHGGCRCGEEKKRDVAAGGNRGRWAAASARARE